MRYDMDKTLTHNCLFNLVIGHRGCGKTYSAKKRAVKNFLNRGEQFVYVRRYDIELDDVKESLFNDIILNGEFKGHVIEYRDGCYFCDDKLMGYAMALTKPHSGGTRMDNLALLKHRKQVLERELENCRYGRQDLYEDLLEIEIMIEREELGNVVRYKQDVDT